MASIKFSSAILLLIFVSSIFSTLINDSEITVLVRDSEVRKSSTGVDGESAFEHTIKLQGNVERAVTCPKAKEGAYQPEGVGSCLVAQSINKRGAVQSGDMICLALKDLFVGYKSVDSINVRARECKGVRRTECRDVKIVKDTDFQIDNDVDGDSGICFNNDASRICKDSKSENCIRYYTVAVSNAASNLELQKAQGACPSAYTTVMVASTQEALKGLSGKCLSTYRCDFEPLNLKCTFARCTFEKQDFPMYIHASGIVQQPDKRGGSGIDLDLLKDEECFKIRVPANLGSAALDVYNPATCGIRDDNDDNELEYAVWVTANICGKSTFYKQQGIINPDFVEQGGYCNLDSQCADGLFCDHPKTALNNNKPTFKCQPIPQRK